MFYRMPLLSNTSIYCTSRETEVVPTRYTLIPQPSNTIMAENEVDTRAPESDAAPANLPASAPAQTSGGLGASRPLRQDLSIADASLRSIV